MHPARCCNLGVHLDPTSLKCWCFLLNPLLWHHSYWRTGSVSPAVLPDRYVRLVLESLLFSVAKATFVACDAMAYAALLQGL